MPSYVGGDPIVDANEEALERASRTISVSEERSLYLGLEHPVHELAFFDGPSPFVHRPELA